MKPPTALSVEQARALVAEATGTATHLASLCARLDTETGPVPAHLTKALRSAAYQVEQVQKDLQFLGFDEAWNSTLPWGPCRIPLREGDWPARLEWDGRGFGYVEVPERLNLDGFHSDVLPSADDEAAVHRLGRVYCDGVEEPVGRAQAWLAAPGRLHVALHVRLLRLPHHHHWWKCYRVRAEQGEKPHGGKAPVLRLVLAQTCHAQQTPAPAIAEGDAA
ncbi:hypothetical protein ACIP5N_21240 [Streptomyces sp. NPDC088768]|uniref:hypothetical protein n=1 Tax=Streptomyces sp. NPDC088768 TaxID=3365894 RepID=UPI00380CC418